MALLKHPRTLTDRIPEEVRQRTRKAGAEEIDWYAGRLDVTNVGSNHAFTDPPSEEIARLKAMAAKRRRARRAETRRERLLRRVRAYQRRKGAR